MKALWTPEQLAARLLANHMGNIVHDLLRGDQREGSISIITERLHVSTKNDGGFDQKPVAWKLSPSLDRQPRGGESQQGIG